jgi:hypothetical protein
VLAFAETSRTAAGRSLYGRLTLKRSTALAVIPPKPADDRSDRRLHCEDRRPHAIIVVFNECPKKT